MASELLEITEETFAGVVPSQDDVESVASDGTLDLNDLVDNHDAVATDENANANVGNAADEKTAADKPVSEKPADEKTADEKAADEKPADEKPADEKNTVEKTADEKPVDAEAVVAEVVAAAVDAVVADGEPAASVDATPRAASAAAATVVVVDPEDPSSSSSSSSSSSGSESSSSSDSSDSEIEDVTHQYKQATELKPSEPSKPESEDEEEDVDAEQWFQRHDLEADGMEIVGVVASEPNEDDDVDVFLLPNDSFASEIERGSATKRRRSEHEETCSSSDPEQSEDEFGRRRSSTNWKKNRKKPAPQPRKRTHATPPPSYTPTPVYTSVPKKFDVFESIAVDDSEFPILKGEYSVRGGHRAHFSGLWGFTENDFTRGIVSKFDYTSGYIHGRRDDDRHPFSGVYGGYFNLRQFNGKIMKIKEEHIEFHFLQIAGEDGQPPREDDPRYEVFGEGKNRYGRFLVRGYFNAENGRMTVRRRYLE